MELTFVVATSEQQMLDAYRIRRAVFTDEQGVPPTLERDTNDENAIHFLAYVGEEAVGAARARSVSETEYKVERVAIIKHYRGLGLGRKMFGHVLSNLKSRGAKRMVIHAQISVVTFYERLGLIAEGPVFEEAGISHRKMAI